MADDPTLRGLDPSVVAAEAFTATDAYRTAWNIKANELEPPFPYTVVPFNPQLFSLDQLKDISPYSDIRVPIIN